MNGVGLRLPKTLDPPNAAQAAGPWRRKTGGNPGPSVPPTPARFPELALSSMARHRDADLALDCRLNAKSRPVHEAVRASRPFNEVNIHGRKPVVAGSIPDRSSLAIRNFIEPALR